MNLATLTELLAYGDWANAQLLPAAKPLTDAQLDEPFDMGRGSLRRTLMHLYAGEFVWLRRWQGAVETPWIDEDEVISIADLTSQWQKTYAERTDFLRGLTEDRLKDAARYRDSKGGLFATTLGSMMTQMCIHSTHHRAQAVNMLRRLGAGLVELDHMMWARQAVEQVAPGTQAR